MHLTILPGITSPSDLKALDLDQSPRPDIEEQLIVAQIEDAVPGNKEFNPPEPWGGVATGPLHLPTNGK